MNHNLIMQIIEMDLKTAILAFALDIRRVKDPKHRVALQEEFDKMTNWMLHMTKCMDDLNCWLTAFGVDENANENA